MKLEDIPKILFIIGKNLKIVLRSWTSIMYLILGPMFLILLIGFAFSSDDINQINIGVIAPENEYVDQVLLSLEGNQTAIQKYGSSEICIEHIKEGSIHICAEFSNEFSNPNLKTANATAGMITFYYDNSKFNLVKSIIGLLKEKINIVTSEITLSTTQSLFGDIQSAVLYLQDTAGFINQLKTAANTTQGELIDLRKELIGIQANLQPRIEAVKALEPKIDNASSAFFEAKNNISQLADETRDKINDVELNVSAVTKAYYQLINLSKTLNLTLPPEVSDDSFLGNLTNITTFFIDQVNTIEEELNATEDKVKDIVLQYTTLVQELEEMDRFLNESIVLIDKKTEDLKEGLTQIEELSKTLDEQIVKFSGIDESQAETLLKPIRSEYTELLGDASRISLMFPVLLIFVVLFISLLLSNMMIMNETHSQAFFRNFLLPVPNLFFVLGMYITTVIVISLQVLVLLLVAQFQFHIDVFSVLLPISICIFLTISIFILLGMILGLIIKQKETSILVTIFVALAFFLFSAIIFPLEIMPPLAFNLASLSPVVLGESMFRKILFFNLPLSSLNFEILITSVYSVVLFIVAYLSYLKNKK